MNDTACHLDQQHHAWNYFFRDYYDIFHKEYLIIFGCNHLKITNKQSKVNALKPIR